MHPLRLNVHQLGLKEVVEKNIHGQAVTPYLLKRVNEITQGVSLESNIDLVNNNATVGSQVYSCDRDYVLPTRNYQLTWLLAVMIERCRLRAHCLT